MESIIETGPLLDAQRVAQYRERGFVLGGRLLSDAHADELFRTIHEIIVDERNAHHSRVHDFKHGGRPLLHIRNMWQRFDSFRALHESPAIVRALSDLTGLSGFQLWQDRFFYKPGGSGSFHTWHQDARYLPFLAPYLQLTAWIALTDANSYNGSMSMVPGSQEWGDAYDHLLEIASLAQDNAPIPDSYQGHRVEVVPCPVPKGHVHFHTGLTWHCSGPNSSADPRCGIALHFVSAGVRFDANHPVAKDYRGVHGEPLDQNDYPLVRVADRAEVLAEAL